MKKYKYLKQVSVIIFLLFVVSCGGQFGQMSAVDKAASVAKELTNSYLTLYSAASDLTKNGTEVQKTFMKEKVNAKINEAKKAVIGMDLAIATWKDTGSDTLNAQQKQAALIILLQEISQLIFSIT